MAAEWTAKNRFITAERFNDITALGTDVLVYIKSSGCLALLTDHPRNLLALKPLKTNLLERQKTNETCGKGIHPGLCIDALHQIFFYSVSSVATTLAREGELFRDTSKSAISLLSYLSPAVL